MQTSNPTYLKLNYSSIQVLSRLVTDNIVPSLRIPSTLKMEVTVLTSPHGATCQKTAIFIVTTLITSNNMSLKFIYSTIQVSTVLVLSDHFKLISSVFQTCPLFSWNSCWLYVLCCSHYPHILHLDAVSTIFLDSFDLIILSILCLTMVCTSRIHNNLNFLWTKLFIFW
jgi:hypothetical protein